LRIKKIAIVVITVVFVLFIIMTLIMTFMDIEQVEIKFSYDYQYLAVSYPSNWFDLGKNVTVVTGIVDLKIGEYTQISLDRRWEFSGFEWGNNSLRLWMVGDTGYYMYELNEESMEWMTYSYVYSKDAKPGNDLSLKSKDIIITVSEKEIPPRFLRRVYRINHWDD